MLHNRYSLPMPNQSIPYKKFMKFWNMAIIGGRIIHIINYANNFNLNLLSTLRISKILFNSR